MFMTIYRWIFIVMRNFSNKSCRGNQNTHFVSCKFFFLQKIVPFMRYCRKIWWRQRGRKWQYVGALHAGLVRLHTRKHMLAPVHQCPYPPTHTHTNIYYYLLLLLLLLLFILVAFPRQQWFCEGASILRCTYIACLVFIWYFTSNLALRRSTWRLVSLVVRL
jgi:hypothetical protein